MTETTDLLNSGEDVILSQVWTLSHIGPDQKGAFSRWAKARARKELDDQLRDGIIDKATYQRDLRALSNRFLAGDYNWGSMLSDDDQGDAIQALLESSDGACRLTQLLLEPRHGPVPAPQILALMQEAEQQRPENAPDEWKNPLALAVSRCLLPAAVPNSTAPAMSQPGKMAQIVVKG